MLGEERDRKHQLCFFLASPFIFRDFHRLRPSSQLAFSLERKEGLKKLYDPSFGANLTLAAPGEGRGGKEIESLSHFWQGRFSRSGQMRQNYSACAEIFFTL